MELGWARTTAIVGVMVWMLGAWNAVPATAAHKGAKHRTRHHRVSCPRKRQRHFLHSFKPLPARCRANPTPARVKPHKESVGGKLIVGGPPSLTPPANPPVPDNGEDEGIPIPAGPYIAPSRPVIAPAPPTTEANPLAPARDLGAHAASVGDI